MNRQPSIHTCIILDDAGVRFSGNGWMLAIRLEIEWDLIARIFRIHTAGLTSLLADGEKPEGWQIATGITRSAALARDDETAGIGR